jgi:hypothetical protein
MYPCNFIFFSLNERKEIRSDRRGLQLNFAPLRENIICLNLYRQNHRGEHSKSNPQHYRSLDIQFLTNFPCNF